MPTSSSSRLGLTLARSVLLLGLFNAFALTAIAQPQIGSFDPRSLQLDGEQTVVVQGSGFNDSTRLISDLELEQRIVDVQAGRITLAVRAQGLPGLHPVWLANAEGVSNSVLIAVDRVPTIPWTDAIEQLPIALHGDLRGNLIQTTRFRVKPGQRVAIEVESRRLGAALQPVVRVWDSRGRQLASATPDPRIQGDCRTELIAEAEDTLLLELSDLLRRGATPGTFRLRIGDFPLVDAVQPMVVGLGSEPGTPRVVDQDQLTVQLPQPGPFASWFPALVGEGNTAMLPMVRVVPWSVATTEQLAGGSSIAAPASISGQLDQAGPDRVRVQVPAGQRVAIELWSYRLGVEGDFVIDVRAGNGQGLGRSDDASGSRDPRLELAVPADQTEIEIVISDLLARRKQAPYLLEVTLLDQPKVKAALEIDHLAIGRNRQTIALPLNRSNYAGGVSLRLEPEIPGVHVESIECHALANRALVQIWSDGPFPDQIARLIVQAQEASDIARRAADKLPAQGWLSEPIAIAFREEPDLSVALPSFDANRSWWQGANVRVPVEVTRSPGLDGPVRVSLETTQRMPRKIVKQDNQDREVDAIEQALRLESTVTIAAGTNSGEVVIVVPIDLPPQEWHASIVVEALSADGNTVLARSSSPLFPVSVRAGLALALTSSATLPFGPGAEAPIVIQGTIERKEGFASPSIVMLDGLPGMVMSPEVELAADATEFSIELSLPADAKLEEWANVRVVARAWDEDGFLQAESPSAKLTFQVPQ